MKPPTGLTVGPEGNHLLHLPAPVELLLLLQGHLHGPVQDGGLHHLAEGLREVVHGDHLQGVAVHSPQVVHETPAGSGLHHIVGHALTDLHRLQQVGHEEELWEEVLALRHGEQARVPDGRERVENGSGSREHQRATANLVTTWEPKGGGDGVSAV